MGFLMNRRHYFLPTWTFFWYRIKVLVKSDYQRPDVELRLMPFVVYSAFDFVCRAVSLCLCDLNFLILGLRSSAYEHDGSWALSVFGIPSKTRKTALSLFAVLGLTLRFSLKVRPDGCVRRNEIIKRPTGSLSL